MPISKYNMADTIDKFVEDLKQIIPQLCNKVGGIQAYSYMLEQDNVPETAKSDSSKILKLSKDITVTIDNAFKHYTSAILLDYIQTRPTAEYKTEMYNLVKELGIYLTRKTAQIKSMAENLLSTYTLEGDAKKDADGIIEAADNTLNEIKTAYARLGITASSDEPITYRIVAVDDMPEIREIIKRILDGRIYNNQGRQVTFKVDVMEKAELALEYLQTNETDLLLTDREMPGTDGWKLLEMLGSLDKDGRYTPKQEYRLPASRVIMLTGGATESDFDRLLNNGIGYLIKPIDASELQKKICETIEQTP